MDVASIVRLMATMAWLLFFAVIVVAIVRASRGRPVKGLTTIIIVLGVSALLLSIAGAGLVFVRPENRGVVISAISPQGYRRSSFGARTCTGSSRSLRAWSPTRSPSRRIRCLSRPMREQSRAMISITARTADGQEIFVDASVIFGLDPAEVVKVHIAWQDRYANDLVRPLSRGVIRDVVSQYRVEEVVTSKRVEMTDQISNSIQQKLADNGLLMSQLHPAQYHLLPGVCRLGGAEADRRAAGAAGQAGRRAAQAGGRAGPPAGAGRGG